MKNFFTMQEAYLAFFENASALTHKQLAQTLGWPMAVIKRLSANPQAMSFQQAQHIGQTILGPKEPHDPLRLKFIDLFAGIGGMRLGFESINAQCVFTSEWNAFSQYNYKANFKDGHPVYGDITKIDANDIPDHDILLAGFPCQPFSLAGKKQGFADTRGTLFFDVARIIEEKQPAAFLLENVKNFKTHDQGRTYQTVVRVLQELGYTVHTRIINAQSLVPQKRERIFLVGFKHDFGFNFDQVLQDLQQSQATGTLKAPVLADILHPQPNEITANTQYLKADGTPKDHYTISDKLWQYLQNHKDKHAAKGNGFGFGLCQPNDVARTISARYYKDGSEILISQQQKNPRRLTPREAARLQGFPESYKIAVSDMQAYKQFGNSVAVPVIAQIAKAMEPFVYKSKLQAKKLHTVNPETQKKAKP